MAGISLAMLRFPLMLVSLLLLCFASAQAAVTESPAILFGSVKGKVESTKPDYIAKSDRQFDVVVDDATYARIMAKVAEWRDREQPSYSLNKRNCVHFVMELAEVVGLKVNRRSKLFKKPKSFLQEVKELNPALG